MKLVFKCIDCAGLRSLYESDLCANAVLDHIAARSRQWDKTSVDAAHKPVAEDFKWREVKDVLKTLDSLGFGHFRTWNEREVIFWRPGTQIAVGRAAKGDPAATVLLESIAAEEAARLPAGEPAVIAKVPQPTEEPPEPETAPEPAPVERGCIRFHWPLRPGQDLAFVFPADLTPREAERLAAAITALPYE